jgi:tetratricopeptide (TPR) repeat protein
MSDSIEDLAQRWKHNPDASGAVVLCDMLRKSAPTQRAALVDEVGRLATAKHGGDAKVLLAVAKLYVEAQRLSDAQAALISAGRIAPRDAVVYRWLGEVLLRRGDAERAEKVLDRARQLGASDPETALWLDRAKVFKPVQAKAGVRAVAVEVAQTAINPITPLPISRKRPPMDSIDDDASTSVRASPHQAQQRGDDPLDRTSREVSIKTKVAPPVSPLADDEAPTRTRASPPRGPATGSMGISPHPSDDVGSVSISVEITNAVPRGAAQEAHATLLSASAMTPPPLNDASSRRAKSPRRPPPPEAPASPPAFSPPPAPRGKPKADAPYRSGTNGIPSPREVLDALSNAGVFEAREAAAGPIVWDRPRHKTRRGTSVFLGVAMTLVVGVAVGVYMQIEKRRALEHNEAEEILAKVEATMRASQVAALPAAEQLIGRAFELDSRSPRAAVDWAEERALKGILQGGAEIAFEETITRALEVRVPEANIAFARVASFLFQGDISGAAGVMPKWDGQAAGSAWYQLITGATLERAGDPHAAERYLAATKLDPDLIVAQVALAKQTAIDGNPAKAAELAKAFREKHPDRIEGPALIALAWARDPGRGEQPPPEAAEAIAHAADMPLALGAVSHALLAIEAVDKKVWPDAKAEVNKGLQVADGPGVATWLGSIALDTGDEGLARKAALTAVAFSGVYAPARVLAGRVALLGGRLDEALKATEDLEPNSPDVAIVRAAVAYERVDGDATSRALDAVSADAKRVPVFSALNLAPAVLLGRVTDVLPKKTVAAKLLEMSDDEAPWTDLITMDAALDLGLTDVADKIAIAWKGSDSRPLRSIRLARLARYENHLDQADALSKGALESATVTPRTLLERAFVLVAKNRSVDVGPLLAKYPLVLGPSAAWLSAYALAATGKTEEARGHTAQLDLPPAFAPLPFRVLAAVSLATMKDKKRADPAIKALLATGIADPDLLAAAATAGVKK